MKNFLIILTIIIVLANLSINLNAQTDQKTGSEYIVKHGDTLSSLAQKFYSDHFAWPAIFEATNDKAKYDKNFIVITKPEHLTVGQKLWIPDISQVEKFLEKAEIRGDITAHGKEEVHWGYEGENGPENWGKLDKFYTLCEQGRKQSPVNLSNPSQKQLSEIIFQYKPTKLNILNNGHTIQVNYDGGSYIETGGITYSLLQFHFHTPSEHKIEDRSSPMEMHLVHESETGDLAVIGVMFEVGNTKNILVQLWGYLPENEQPEEQFDILVNAAELLPEVRATYQYKGSLTTPPCSENVSWFVMENPIEISEDQLNKFRNIFELNNRPVQRLNDRIIFINRD